MLEVEEANPCPETILSRPVLAAPVFLPVTDQPEAPLDFAVPFPEVGKY